MSSYFQQLSGLQNVGIFYLIAYVIILFCFLNLHRIVGKFGKTNVFCLALFIKINILLLLLFIEQPWICAILVISYMISNSLEIVSLDIILESHSNDVMSGRIRGKFLTLLNAGFLLAPFISTRILEAYNFYGIFLTLLIFNTAVFFFSIFNIKTKKESRDRSIENLTIKKISSK